MRPTVLLGLGFAMCSLAHSQQPLTGSTQETWLSKYGKPIDPTFSGFLSFSRLPYAICLEDETANFDIAILGFPFDTGVSYRPGARFGPFGIRAGSRRQRDYRGWTMFWGINPYKSGSTIIDCGDVSRFPCCLLNAKFISHQIPLSPFDNAIAIDQMEVA